jgi:hypothetical protein
MVNAVIEPSGDILNNSQRCKTSRLSVPDCSILEKQSLLYDSACVAIEFLEIRNRSNYFGALLFIIGFFLLGLLWWIFNKSKYQNIRIGFGIVFALVFLLIGSTIVSTHWYFVKR